MIKLQVEKKQDDEIEQLFLQGIYLEHLHLVECHFWAQPASSVWWDRIGMQNWDDREW